MHAWTTDECDRNALKSDFFFAEVFVLWSMGNELVLSPSLISYLACPTDKGCLPLSVGRARLLMRQSYHIETLLLRKQ